MYRERAEEENSGEFSSRYCVDKLAVTAARRRFRCVVSVKISQFDGGTYFFNSVLDRSTWEWVAMFWKPVQFIRDKPALRLGRNFFELG